MLFRMVESTQTQSVPPPLKPDRTKTRHQVSGLRHRLHAKLRQRHGRQPEGRAALLASAQPRQPARRHCRASGAAAVRGQRPSGNALRAATPGTVRDSRHRRGGGGGHVLGGWPGRPRGDKRGQHELVGAPALPCPALPCPRRSDSSLPPTRARLANGWQMWISLAWHASCELSAGISCRIIFGCRSCAGARSEPRVMRGRVLAQAARFKQLMECLTAHATPAPCLAGHARVRKPDSAQASQGR